MTKTKKDSIQGDLKIEEGVFKKTFYVDGDVLLALEKEGKKRGFKKTTTFLNHLLREILIADNSVESRLKEIEDRLLRLEG